jgi:UDPglucose 6-dehydrogenase
MKVNQTQNDIVEAKIRAALGPKNPKPVVAFLGLTYKPGTSTIRWSSALEIARKLARDGVAVRVFDPKAEPIYPGRDRLATFDSPLSAASGADVIVIATAWPQFKKLDFKRIKSVMRNPVIVDAQNMFRGEFLSSLGFAHYGVGRGKDSGEVPRAAPLN